MRRFLVVLIVLKVFHVLLRGGPLTWSADGSAQTVRFYRNETVLAESKAAAVEKAWIRTWDRLRANPLEYAVNLDQFALEVDDITADFRFWTLVGRQGFIFYPDS